MSEKSFYKIEDEKEERQYLMSKVLFTNPKYNGLSLGAKTMYSVLRVKLMLSAKNNCIDEDNNIFIIFKVEDLCDVLDLSNKAVIKHKRELQDYNLFFEKRIGLGGPNKLYLLTPDHSS